MKVFLNILLLLSSLPAAAVSTWKFTTPRAGEVGLIIHAEVPDTNWGTTNAEAAILTLKVDGKYNQDVTLYMGSTPHDYRVLLGPIAAGKHVLAYERNERYSASVFGKIRASFEVQVVDDPLLAQAPVMYLRPDTLDRFSDIPLVCWYETLDEPGGKVTQYSMIFSNEDGGTNTEALMARWGRTLDIEYVYRATPNGGTFQARNHKETPFNGETFGQHPLIYDVTDNNNFSDSGDSGMRIILWPQPFKLSEHSREEVADQNPWTYRIMAEELKREGKMEKLGDPRGYLYIEAKVQSATAAISFSVGEASSDRGLATMRINRDGWVRSAIALGTRNVPQLEVRCHQPSQPKPDSNCTIEAISKVFFLDKEYRPLPSVMEWRGTPIRLAPGAGYLFTPPKK